MTSTYYAAWWNLENLFDYENSRRRSSKLKRVLGESIRGWTPELRDRKIAQLVSVIARMNDGAGPDLLGVCEVENEWVLTRLATAVSRALGGRDYAVAHADTIDERGIDVAFLYDPALFTAPVDQVFQHVVMRRTATREIVQVNFTTRAGHTWAVFGNHWPSRSGGQLESAGYRAIAGETLAYFHERLLEVHGEHTPALVMGDFNDEPADPSLVQYALSTRQRVKVAGGSSPRLWNLMWETLGAREGSFYFENFPYVLDQFLVNKSMATTAGPLSADPATVQLVRFEGMTSTGTYPTPTPFGGMGNPININGYSDHLPISMLVTETA